MPRVQRREILRAVEELSRVVENLDRPRRVRLLFVGQIQRLPTGTRLRPGERVVRDYWASPERAAIPNNYIFERSAERITSDPNDHGRVIVLEANEDDPTN